MRYGVRDDDDKRTSDGPVNDRSIFELDGDGLVVQLHQKPDVMNQRKWASATCFSELFQGQNGKGLDSR